MRLLYFVFIALSTLTFSAKSADAAYVNLKQSEQDRLYQCATYQMYRELYGVDCKHLIGTQKNAESLMKLKAQVDEQVSKMSFQDSSQKELMTDVLPKLATACLRGFKACRKIHTLTRMSAWERLKNRKLRNGCNELCSAATCRNEGTLAGCQILHKYYFNPDINQPDIKRDNEGKIMLGKDGNIIPAEGSDVICPKKYVKNCLGKNAERHVNFEEEDATGMIAFQMFKENAVKPAKGQALTYRFAQAGAALATVAVGVAAGPFIAEKAAAFAKTMQSNPLSSFNAANRVRGLGNTAKGLAQNMVPNGDMSGVDISESPSAPSMSATGAGGTSVGAMGRSVGAGGSGYAYAK